MCDHAISILISLPWMMWKPLFHVWMSVNPGSALKYIIGHWELSLKVFPLLLSGSRRRDHRTSLHRWQLRLKVIAAAEGPIDYWPGVKFYPASLFSCLCQILYYPERWDVTAFHQRHTRKACNFVFIILFPLPLFFVENKSNPPGSALFWGTRGNAPGLEMGTFKNMTVCHLWFITPMAYPLLK